jgi:pimeloyl-ACP methyl ester carboxylesterase
MVAQMIARDCAASALVLVCSATPAGVKALPPLPPLRSLLSGLALVPGALGGGTFQIPDALYRELGLNCVDDASLGEILPRMAPWSAQVTRALFLRRPRVETPDCPVLVTFGAKDALLPPRASRLLGDLHHAVTWRFDDLGHMPPLETRGVRHAEAVARWIANPTRRRLTEIDPMAPDEGVGQEARAARHNPRAPRSHSRFRRSLPKKPGRG